MNEEIQKALETLAKYLHEELPNETNFWYTIRLNGNVKAGTTEIIHRCDSIYKQNSVVEGGNVENVVYEYRRRQEFEEINRPLKLLPQIAPPPKVIETTTNETVPDEMPF